MLTRGELTHGVRLLLEGSVTVAGMRTRLDVADGAMLVVAVIWAANNVITKAILNDRIDPLPYVFCRFALVTVLLFGWLRLRREPLRVQWEDLRRFLVTGITGYAAYNLFFVVGLSRTTAFSAAIMISLGPVFTLIFAAALKLERVRAVQWLGVACAFGGVALFVGEKLAEGRPALGDSLNLLGAACFAVYGLSIRPMVTRYGSPIVTAWSVLIGLIAVTPVTAVAVVRQDWGRVGLAGWAALFYAGAFSMLVAYTIWGWAIERRGVGRTVPFLFLVPIVTGFLAMLFLGERFSAFKILGAVLVFAGVALARRSAVPGAAVVPAKIDPPLPVTSDAPDADAAAGRPQPVPTPGP
jgi:drug/metabolite transporter (DMT)-like permease